MDRVPVTPRPDWRDHAEAVGFNWHTSNVPYWDESAYYGLTDAEGEEIFNATREAYAMLLETIASVIDGRRLPLFGFTPRQIDLIEKSWQESDNEPSLYGRFNLAKTAGGLKVLSFNGDNPTGLFETSIFQRQWLDAVYGEDRPQFNNVHEALSGLAGTMAKSLRRAAIRDDERSRDGGLVHVVSGDDPANVGTAEYLCNVLGDAGINVKYVDLTLIGIADGSYFVDDENNPITTMVKLEALDGMTREDEFGDKLITEVLAERMRIIEPAWKMLASDNRLMAEMWDANAYHPLLLNTSTVKKPEILDYVTKPFQSRDGQNITITKFDGSVLAKTGGVFGDQQVVYQEFVDLGEGYPVIGSWIVGGDPVGVGIREGGLITTAKTGRFLPHRIV